MKDTTTETFKHGIAKPVLAVVFSSVRKMSNFKINIKNEYNHN